LPISKKIMEELILQGNVHTYVRGIKKIPMPFKKGATSATMYVASMSGSKMYDDKRQDWMDKEGVNIQLYQIITVDGNTLSYKSYGVTGELFDAFELKKVKGKNNKLIDK